MTHCQNTNVSYSKDLPTNIRSRKQRELLVLKHLPLIRFIVHRMAVRLPRWIDSKDLINTGILGLLDAATKYDSSHNVLFKTYAELRIRGAILDSLRRLDWVPRSLRQKERTLERTRGELEKRLGREADEKEIAHAMGLKLREYRAMSEEVKSMSFGHFRPAPANKETTTGAVDPIEFLPAGKESDPYLVCERSEMRRILGQLIDTLRGKERMVISLYYYEELSMKEIGSILHVNESRVSQLRQKAMFHLRRRLKNTLSGMKRL